MFVLQILNQCNPITCPAGFNNTFSRYILYQVLDQSGSAIQKANMTAQEYLSTDYSTCNGTFTPASTTTDQYGDFADNLWLCCIAASNCRVSLSQRFSVNGYPVQVTTGLNGGLTGSHNVDTFSCTNGSGACPVITPTP
jgi:hypothetical protein